MVAVSPCCLDQAEDTSTGPGTGSGISKQEILPRDGNRFGHVLGLDIGDRQATIIAVVLQLFGVLDQIRQRVTCAGMGHSLDLYLACPRDKFLPVGHGLRLASLIFRVCSESVTD